MLWSKPLLYYLMGQTSLLTNTLRLNSTVESQNIMRVLPSNSIPQFVLNEVLVSRRKQDDKKAFGTDHIDVSTYKTYFSAFSVCYIITLHILKFLEGTRSI